MESTWSEVTVAGRCIHLLTPTAQSIASEVGAADIDGPGDAELHTWAVPWESGLFAQMALWDLSNLDVTDLGCGLGLAGCFASLQGARSVLFADRCEAAVRCALRSAAACPGGATCRIHGRDGCWAGASAWPSCDLLLGNEVLYTATAVEQLTTLVLSPALRPNGIAVFCGCDRGLWDRLEDSLTAAGLHVQCLNGFVEGTAGSLRRHPSVLLLVSKLSSEGLPREELRSVAIRPEAWLETCSERPRLAPPALVAAPPAPPFMLTTPSVPPPSPPAPLRLRPLTTLTQAPAAALAEHLEGLEHARASCGAEHASWMVEAVVGEWAPPAPPRSHLSAAVATPTSFGVQVCASYLPNLAAAELGAPLRAFYACLMDEVQQLMHEPLQALGAALAASVTTRGLRLQLHTILTVSRTPAEAEYRHELLHADAFDGTVLALAFLCSKMGTRLFPNARFVEPPLEQFLRESRSGKRNGFSRVVEGKEGAMERLSPRQLLILSAAVAHARPDGRVDAHAPIGPRWFARAHLELRPAGGPKAWDAQQRMAVALLVAEHVWRDASFVAAAKERLSVEQARTVASSAF